MSARITRECLYRFCHNVVKLYRKQYLRKPNAYDVQQLYQAHEARHGFPGMLGSIDFSGVEYRRGYYLADGIYPSWSTIVKTIPFPDDEKRKKWAIIQQPARAFTPKRLRLCMYACILLHNMIIEDEGRAICEYDENASYGNTVMVDPTQQDLNSFALTNDYTHANLQQDLVEHIWNNANDGDGDEDE
ncbi:uncharacterized protein LOC110869675 [Helianthus annuus]|uniref:uncharacterized protein LOC110869675 n=1 Tax=Helianthus annuus TaxID=4232 RepID=UPI000B9048AA|nr:uncharacterized protein LOC110869675 [Helianthus annuus]